MTSTIEATKARAAVMHIDDMIAIAKASDEAVDTYWGEKPSVMKLHAAYFGGFNTARDTRNFDRVRRA